MSRTARGKAVRPPAATRLPSIHWRSALEPRAIRLVETGKVRGNVRLGELGVLAVAAANVPPGQEIIEIGTFDGRTTLNLAINAPGDCRIFTLDLPPDHPSRFELDARDLQFVRKSASGERYKHCPPAWRSAASRITQLWGDSAALDWSPYWGRAGLVFVDGSHAYEYVDSDTVTAFKLLSRGGMILWHDYGIWDGVTRALEEIEAKHSLGLKHLRGTSLVCWSGETLPSL